MKSRPRGKIMMEIGMASCTILVQLVSVREVYIT